MRRSKPNGRRPRPNHRTTKRVDAELTCPFPKLATVQPVPRNQLRPGTVVWAHIPFAESDEEKTRPAIVRSISGRSVTVHPVTTSATRRRYPGRYVELTGLTGTGLHDRPASASAPSPSTPSRINIAGHLSDIDHDRVLQASNHNSVATRDAA